MAAPRKNHRGASNRNGRELIDVTIPSDFGASRQLQREVQAHLLAHHYSEESFFAIKLALEEALLNAIKHGNRQDQSK
ncbi:MAG TPA: ATP-binding protein, partial [Tepidisphaeraceae bacterium]|nr:ATP-binding protein [Tepidisphaeraceae bacterium]